MKKFILYSLLVFQLFGLEIVHATTKYGNYLDSRIGDANNQKYEALLYHADREWLYDFDTPAPLDGVTASASTIESSSKFYMSAPQSLKWNTSQGASLTLNANINVKKVWPTHYYITVGVFQEDVPTGADKRAFKVELLSSTNSVLASRNIYLHRGGWNILCSNLNFTSSQFVSTIKITQVGGSAGSVLLDNFMISAFQNKSDVFMSNGTHEVEKQELTMDKAVNYPTTTLTNDQKNAFLTIAERVIPLPSKVSSISDSKMSNYRDLHSFYNIETNGDYAKGKNPLYYWRTVTQDVTVYFLNYMKNEKLCSEMKNMGKAWYQTNDATQKEELGGMITDLVKLCVTFGDMPNAWYNGRGFAEGVYYAKDLLEQAGLLDRVTTLIMQQYGVDLVLFNEQYWENPIADEKGAPDWFWQASADHLNTASKSMIVSILVGADSPDKARNLNRFKSWMDNISLAYSPGKSGTLKPDGSWYHHWGNRFDNYGWVGGWRGATDLVWWMSHTPFAVSPETKERMNHMADVHFTVMDKNGHNGPQDKMHRVPSDGFLNLAKAGSSDGTNEIDSVPASYWLAYPNESSYLKNSSWVNKMKAQRIEPAQKKDETITMSYESAIYHRKGDWQVFTRGISLKHYHTQYERNGYLFYNIGGISLVKEGVATGMQRFYGAQLLQRHGDDLENITNGYNFSRAPGVTSAASDYSRLRQLYYQTGTSGFVGGLSTSTNKGIFVQEFDASKKSKYSTTVAKSLRFNKSYFLFGDDIVLLASGISNGGSLNNVETGLMQEPVSSGRNELTFANDVTTINSTYNETYASDDVPWMFNNTLKTGLYLLPNQNYTLFKGSQTFGPLTGNIISTYLTHDGQTSDGWYEFVISLNTTKTKMKELETAMKEAEPEFKVLQRDSKAHIVHCKSQNTTGYAIFNAQGWESPGGPVISADAQCVVMAQQIPSEASLILTVSNPDKKTNESASNPLGWSQPTEIEIVVEGKYNLYGKSKDGFSSEVDEVKNTTKISVKVKDGLPEEILLKEDRKKNSIPWVEDFSLKDETINDSGMSSWNLEAFDAQEVGFAYVKDNDLWMSGINCNWQSEVIDISSAEEVRVKVSLRCDQPKRINRNDSVSVFYKVDDSDRQLLLSLVDDFEDTTFVYSGISGDSLKLFIEGRSDRNYAAFIIENVEVLGATSTFFKALKIERDFKIYPIPFSESITISGNRGIECLKLYNLHGMLIESKNICNRKVVHYRPYKKLLPGYYFIQLIGENESEIYKICCH